MLHNVSRFRKQDTFSIPEEHFLLLLTNQCHTILNNEEINQSTDSNDGAIVSECRKVFPLRKHAYSNILKILQPKKEKFRIKKSDIFHIPAQNIDCGYSLESPRRGGSNEYPQTMFLSRNKKNNVYPVYYIKVGFNGVKIYRHVFAM